LKKPFCFSPFESSEHFALGVLPCPSWSKRRANLAGQNIPPPKAADFRDFLNITRAAHPGRIPAFFAHGGRNDPAKISPWAKFAGAATGEGRGPRA